MNRKNEARSLETVVSPKRVSGKYKTADLDPKPADYDVLVVGGGPAGLTAAACCGRKLLRTGIFEGDSWGGILTRWCPDKRIRITSYNVCYTKLLRSYLASFTISLTAKPSPLTRLQIAASSPKKPETTISPFSLPGFRPRESFVSGSTTSRPSPKTRSLSPMTNPVFCPALMAISASSTAAIFPLHGIASIRRIRLSMNWETAARRAFRNNFV